MKICLIGEYKGVRDEGAKNVFFNICDYLKSSNRYDILQITLSDIYPKVLTKPKLCMFAPSFYMRIKDFNPEIIHYFPISGLTIPNLAKSKILNAFAPEAKLVVSTLQTRYYPDSWRYIFNFIKPDMILISSQENLKMLTNLKLNVKFMPTSVCIDKFKPVNKIEKLMLKKKYNIATNRFVILHVGHLTKSRNIEILKKIQNDLDVQVILVASTSTKIDLALYRKLKGSGILILTQYLPNIEEIYGLSDCFIFPVEDPLGSIDIPLSILEAMSCNLPVVSTRFGGIPDIFSNGDGLFFYKDYDNLKSIINIIKDYDSAIRTREKVIQYSHEDIVRNLEHIYEEVIS